MSGNVYDIGLTLHITAGIVLAIAMILWAKEDTFAGLLVALATILTLTSILAYGATSHPAWIQVFGKNTMLIIASAYFLTYPVRRLIR